MLTHSKKLLGLAVFIGTFVSVASADQASSNPTPQPMNRLPMLRTPRVTPRYATPNELSASSQGIQFALVTSEDPYLTNKPILVLLYTKSALRHDVVLDLNTDVKYEVFGASAVAVTQKVHREILHPLKQTTMTIVAIRPGVRLDIGDDLSQLFNMPPGRYTIRATLYLRSIGAVLHSPPATLVVD